VNNKVVNKQIPIKSIIDVANYFGDYKNRYDNIFEQEKIKNKDVDFSDKNYEYENGSTELRYTVKLRNGKDMTETDYNWFIGQLSQPSAIEEIIIDLRVSYYNKSGKENYNDQYNSINASVDFMDARMDLKYSDVFVNVQTTNQEREADNIYSTIMNTLENNDDRLNKTIKYRKIRIQSLCISVGIILSYILYIVLRMNADKIPVEIATYLTNKYVIVFGQWLVAILLGNVVSYGYILSVYSPLLPEEKYAGYDSSAHKSMYKDDIDDYIEHSEVHFGKFWDAEKRRTKIEKIFSITKWIVLAQLLISVILFFVLK
jgi:hypothetical protein